MLAAGRTNSLEGSMAKKRTAKAETGMDEQIDAVEEAGAPGTDEAAVAAAAPVSVLKKKDLVERVAKRTAAKKSEARDIVDAVLAELGAALARGDELNLPPLGKAKVNKTRDIAQGEVLIVKLRRSAEGKETGETPLADTDE
jgi:nucleoid DNA-binding protein